MDVLHLYVYANGGFPALKIEGVAYGLIALSLNLSLSLTLSLTPTPIHKHNIRHIGAHTLTHAVAESAT